MERSSKQQENLRRDINSILRDFQKNRQWADFSNWLHRLLEILTPRRATNLPQQLNLCKRLAQCLNPSLPAGVHSTALKVYETILHNIEQKTQLLPLTAMGILPFFEHSNTQNKHTVLKIFEEHFISDIEGIQMIVGLMNALLTVLNENSEQLAKKVYGICDNITKNYGRMWVDGAVWVNILKSPKVRLAGFKYFTKVFRDRDKAAQQQKEKQMQEGKQKQKIIEKEQLEKIEKKIDEAKLGQEQKVLLTSLYNFKEKPDDHSTRFPNFSSLVVNSLSVCLDANADNMIKRAALDLLGGYLKLSNGVFGRRQGVILLEKMLLLLQGKQYSLTNRVYKYLFDQPNTQGYFTIDLEKKKYQLQVLKQALCNLLTPNDDKEPENVLLILQILIGDHPALAEFLLERLAFEIVNFAEKEQSKHKKQKNLIKTVTDFYLNVINMHRGKFLSALLNKLPKVKKQQQKQSAPLAPSLATLLQALQFYFGKMQKLAILPRRKNSSEGTEQQKNDQQKEKAEYLTIRIQTLSELIEQLWVNRPFQEQLSIRILDLCNQILAEVQYRCETKEEGLSEQEVRKIQELLTQQSELKRKNIFARLITLHPRPSKQMLLPYIEDGALSIVCINLLLGGDKVNIQSLRPRAVSSAHKKKSRYRVDTIVSEDILKMHDEPLDLTNEEKQNLFFAIFKLLNCHLFQARALDFIERYRYWWGQCFVNLIDKTEPSQWLIYWRKVEGDVAGGILRMIDNLNSQNSYDKHLSRRWIAEAENIISKVIDAIFKLLDKGRKGSLDDHEGSVQFVQANIIQYEKVFNLLQLIFRSTSKDFNKFFFLQKDKYIIPFVLYIFKCLESKQFQTKSKSLSMLSFLLNQAQAPHQKLEFLSLTLPNVLVILDHIIDKKKCIDVDNQKDTNVQHQIVQSSNFQIQLLEYISLGIKRISDIPLGNDGRTQQIIIGCMRTAGIYDILLKGITYTETQYIKKLYIQSSKQFSEMLAKVDKNKTQITTFITRILDKLFILLKNCDVNKVQKIIKNRNEHGPKELIGKRKNSNEAIDVYISFAKETVLETEVKQNLNLEQKYSDIIELWHTVKYYLQFAVRVQLKQMPIINLLSLVLSSFPLSYLKYTAVGSQIHANILEDLEQEAATVTGLKKQVFGIFEILWNKQSRQIVDYLIENRDPTILIHSQLDPSKVLQALNKSSKIKEVSRFLRNQKSHLPKNILYYNIEQLMRENQILYFIYVYLLYCNLRLVRNKRINVFLESLLDTLELLKNSSHTQTKLWLFQIVQLVGQRVISTKEMSIQHGNKIRGDMHRLTKQLIDEQLTIITRGKNFTHRNQIKTGIFGLFSKEEKQDSRYDFVKVFPPTIHESYQRFKQNMKKVKQLKNQVQQNKTKQAEKKVDLEHPRQRVLSYLLELDNISYHQENSLDNFLFTNYVNITQQNFIEYLSLCSLKTFIRIGNSILINIYEKDLAKISMIIKQILLHLLPICENREASNQHANELVAQYLQSVLSQDQLRPQLLRNIRKNILEVYMLNNFFKCTQRTLTHWKSVIDHCIGENNQLLSELLSREGLFENIFTKKAEATRQKIKSLKRVCFIIYAGKVDRYENKLRTVLESLNEVMKQEDASPALLILILFCIRILLMRLSSISLNKLFKSVWPSLITLLIQIFKKSRVPKPCTLQLAALKVIQLIHAMNLEEFMLHRWMFLFDYFGLKIDPMGEIQDNMKQCEMHSPFHFKPYFSSMLPNNRLRCKFLPEPANPPENRIVKRRMIIKKTYSQSEEEVKECALLLMQYMMDLNECRTEISKIDIENLIEDEFVSLDDYIFKVK